MKKYCYIISLLLNYLIFFSVSAQLIDDIYISTGPDTIYLNTEFTYESRFVDEHPGPTYVDYWNWSLNVFHEDSVYVLAADDSVYGHNVCTWTSMTDVLPLPYDSIKNDDPIYIEVNCIDSDSIYHIEYKPLLTLLDPTSSIFEHKGDNNFYLKKFTLDQNYPNPFNPETTIPFTLSQAAKVTIEVYNTLGQRITILTYQVYLAGNHFLRFDGSDLPSGVYIVKAMISPVNDLKDKHLFTKKIMLLK